MRVQCLLWDFGDTLCDELSLWRTSAEWMDVYRSFDDEEGIGAAWSLGKIDTKEVVAKLASRMTLTETQIGYHLSRIDLFEFFPFTYSFFKARHPHRQEPKAIYQSRYRRSRRSQRGTTPKKTQICNCCIQKTPWCDHSDSSRLDSQLRSPQIINR